MGYVKLGKIISSKNETESLIRIKKLLKFGKITSKVSRKVLAFDKP